jgi:phosphohistidine phosphatase
MTRRLILMRHAKSAWNNPVSDHERDLNERGRHSADAMGKWLQSSSYLPDEALVSTALRTRETYDRLNLQTEQVTTVAQLYHASAQVFLECLQKAKGHTVLILGHNPGISEFAYEMAASQPEHSRFDNFPTCATWVADFAIKDWKDARQGIAVSVDFAIPRELIEASDNR